MIGPSLFDDHQPDPPPPASNDAAKHKGIGDGGTEHTPTDAGDGWGEL